MLKTAVKGGTDEGLCEGGLWVIVIAGGKAHAVLGWFMISPVHSEPYMFFPWVEGAISPSSMLIMAF